MANFAVINGGVINNIIVAEDISVAQEAFPQTQHIIEVPTGPGSPGLNWGYDLETGIFTEPQTFKTV
jgi:hypothetical protein